MKKIVIAFAIMITLISGGLIYCLNNRRANVTSDSNSSNCPPQEELEKDYDIAICITNSLSPDEIVQLLATEWLQNSTKPEVSDEYRLNEYRIDTINLLENVASPSGPEQYPLGAQITFSVLPSVDVKKTNWIVPDGLLGQNGWIINKKMYVGVKKLGNGICQLKLLGQCISC